MIRRPPRSTRVRSSAASDVYKRQELERCRRTRGEEHRKNHLARRSHRVEVKPQLTFGIMNVSLRPRARIHNVSSSQGQRRAAHCHNDSMVISGSLRGSTTIHSYSRLARGTESAACQTVVAAANCSCRWICRIGRMLTVPRAVGCFSSGHGYGQGVAFSGKLPGSGFSSVANIPQW